MKFFLNLRNTTDIKNLSAAQELSFSVIIKIFICNYLTVNLNRDELKLYIILKQSIIKKALLLTKINENGVLFTIFTQPVLVIKYAVGILFVLDTKGPEQI